MASASVTSYRPGTDGLDILRRVTAGSDTAVEVERLVALVRGPHYSVSDLVRDVATVRAEGGGDELDTALAECVEQISAVHEVAIETMQHGFCELSPDGRIGYANPALEAMLPGCKGKLLAGYFPTEQALIQRAVSDGQSGHTHQVAMQAAARTRPVMVTIGPGDGPASYAFILDLTEAAAAERRTLDTAPFAILLLNPDHQITYANKEAGRLLGGTAEKLVGMWAGDLAADDAALRTLAEEFKKRQQGETSEYRLDVRPLGLGPSEPMMVRSIPKVEADGRLAGTLVTFRQIGLEEVGAEIREAVATMSEPRSLFKRVVKMLRTRVRFDLAILWLSTGERTHSRLVYDEPPLDVDALWFPVPEKFRPLAKNEASFGDLKQAVEDTEGGDRLSQEKVIRALIDRGMRSWLALPIGDSAQDAVLALYDRRKQRFDDGTAAAVASAGVAEAMQAVLRLRMARETAFQLDLMVEMAGKRTDRELASLVVNELAHFYGWRNVSIFKVNAAHRLFELLDQAPGPIKGYRLPDGHCQPVAAGFLGLAYERKEIESVADAHSRPESSRFVVGSSQTRSELIAPVWSDGQIAWMLNIEDDRPNAFQAPDKLAMRKLMDKIGEGLGHLLRAAMLEQVLEEVPHAVVITDLAGKIVSGNRCAKEMLGTESGELAGFFPGSADAAAAVREETPLPVQGVVTSATGVQTKVLVSARTPRVQYNRRVVFMQDVEKLKRQSETREVIRALGEVAAETRIPLSLASSYIRQIGRRAAAGVAAMADQAAAQLVTVELSYGRVVDRAQRERLPEAVVLATEIDALTEQLPGEFRDRVRVSGHTERVVQADRERLTRVMRGMLAYLLRVGPEGGVIEVVVSSWADWTGLSMSQCAAAEGERDATDMAMARFALDEPGLHQLARQLGGKFKWQRTMRRETLRLLAREEER